MKLKATDSKIIFLFLLLVNNVVGQNTQIRGFVEANAFIQKDKLSFALGEQDLFITSELNDRFSFLGESVFKYSATSPTTFDVSIERIVIKYNLKGNTNILFGKHHTPVNYWNDTYHHGRVFFPTIERPQLFSANIIPLHTTGISLQAHDLGNIKFGYDLMIGNGLGSSDIADNDKYKSITAAVHIKPADALRVGASYYYDVISAGAKVHGDIMMMKVTQQLLTASIACFEKKIEVLAEGTMAINDADSIGSKKTIAAYAYAGYKVSDKLVPYIRYDYIKYEKGEMMFKKDNLTSYVAGIRYHFNYLAVVKLEYQHDDKELSGKADKYIFQIAIGF